MGFWPDVKRGDTVKHHMVLENNLRHMINSLDGFGSGIARGTTGGVVRIQIWNATGGILAAGQPVAFDNTKAMCGDALPAVKVTDTKKPWGVCVNTLDPNAMGDCIISGPAKVALSGGSGDYAEPVVNSSGFTRKNTGTARILFADRLSGVIVLGGGGSSGVSGHPFDVELLKGGTEESPTYSVRVFNSALPDSTYAGIVYIGTATYSVPVDELEIEAGEGEYFAVDLVVTYDAESSPVYTFEFEVRTDSDYEDEDNVFRQTIAEGVLPEIASGVSGNIRITDRWV